MIWSEEWWTSIRDAAYEELKNQGIPDDVFEASIAFGQEIAAAVKDYSSKDNYPSKPLFPKVHGHRWS